MRTKNNAPILLALACLCYVGFLGVPSAFAGAQPTGDQHGATITLASPLVGQVVLSNCRVAYTGSGDCATLGDNSDVENVTVAGTASIRLADNSSGIRLVHDDLPGVYATGTVSNLLIAANAWHTPASVFDHITLDSVGSNVVIVDNQFPAIHEPVHVVNGTGTGFVCSFNEIQQAQRHGIEVQAHLTGYVINNNYIHNWRKNPGDNNAGPNTDSHIGISAATGNDGATPASGGQINNNVINFDGAVSAPIVASVAYLTTGIEDMGNNGTVANNWIKNSGQQLYTNDTGFTSSGNVFIGGKGWAGEGGVNPATAPTVTGDRLFAFADPAAPPMPAGVGPRIIPGPTNSAVPAGGWASAAPPPPSPPSPPVVVAPPPVATPPAALVAGCTSTPTTITVKLQSAAAGTYSIVPSGAPSSTPITGPIAAGTSSLVIPGLTANWEYAITIGQGGASQTVTAQTQPNATSTVSTAAIATPATPPSPPAPPPTSAPPATNPAPINVTVPLQSLDGGKTWSVKSN